MVLTFVAPIWASLALAPSIPGSAIAPGPAALGPFVSVFVGPHPSERSLAQDGNDGTDGDLSEGEPRSLSLQEALALALSNNLTLQRAVIESDAARFDARSSWGSFDWVLDLQASYLDSSSEGASALFGGRVVNQQNSVVNLDLTRPLTTGGSFTFHFDSQFNQTDNQFSNAPELFTDNLRAAFSQPLLRGAGSDYATARQREAEITEQRRLEERRDARQLLLHDVEVAYWELVAALQQLDVARSALDLGRSQVSREEARIRAGDGTEVDVLQARTEVATRTEALLQAENDVAQRGDDLKRLVYADRDASLWTRPLRPTTDLPSADDRIDLPHWQDAFQTALTRRPELRTARLDVDTSRISLTRATSERLYGLDLELSVASGAVDPLYPQALSDTLELQFPRYQAVLSYNMPLQNRTASNAERAARERLRGSQIALEEAEIMALGDVRRAIREVRFRAQAVLAANQSAVLARAQLEAEQKRLDADLSTTFQVLEFQQTLIAALSSKSRAAAEYAKSLIGLRRAQGTVGELPPNTTDR
ncbi:outer membrane channel protein [Planctomycetes bacterium Poly30]|uniref:Outer membrane channel protein n=1 Tax=Saltatorellus ferox TaxID=2528018 RepID=A0A518ETF7_9BACT|nr:outer membrane channel protein [Planctomycetes bacterium Poly30]